MFFARVEWLPVTSRTHRRTNSKISIMIGCNRAAFSLRDIDTAELEVESQQGQPCGNAAKRDSGVQVCPELKNVRIQTSTRTKSVGELSPWRIIIT